MQQLGRQKAYRDLLIDAINDEDLAAIRTYLQQQRAYGHDDFRAMVEPRRNALRACGRRIGRRSQRLERVSEPDPVFSRQFFGNWNPSRSANFWQAGLALCFYFPFRGQLWPPNS